MAEPAPLDIRFVQGDTYRRQFTVQEGDPPAAVDITGWSFLVQIRAGAADNQPVEATLSSTIVDGPGGVFEVVLAPIDSAALAPEVVHYWDVQGTTGAGDVITLVAGQVTVIAEISR